MNGTLALQELQTDANHDPQLKIASVMKKSKFETTMGTSVHVFCAIKEAENEHLVI
jgi:hypothetical protein